MRVSPRAQPSTTSMQGNATHQSLIRDFRFYLAILCVIVLLKLVSEVYP